MNDDGCHVDEEGLMVMKACLEEPIEIGTRGYKPP
jgi:hypothetical protein